MRFLDSTSPTSTTGAAETEDARVDEPRPEPVSGSREVALRWSPLALALVVFLVWAARDGGYASVDWLPGAVFVLGLALVVVLAEGPPFAGRRELATASLLLAGYTVWSFLSISWADVKGDAWDGANRTLLYLCTFVLFAWRPISARIAALLLGSFVAGIATIGAIDFLRAADAAQPAGFFIAGRLSSPISYPNANAALFLMAVPPALLLASRRAVPPPLRGVMLASAGVLAELALLCQSRGSLFALPLVLLVFFAVAPQRLRLLLSLAVVAIPVGLGTGRLLDVYSGVVNGERVHATLTQAAGVMAWSALGLFVAGTAIGFLDRRVQLSHRVTTSLRWIVAAGAAVAVLAGGFVALDHQHYLRDRVSTAWSEFKSDVATDQVRAVRVSHLAGGFASSRYDLWRVALDEFKAAPVRGVGVDNFAVDYLRLRRTDNEPVHQHSLELRVLAQTGLVGAVLFGGFLAAALLAAARSLRRRDEVGSLAAASLAAFAYWLVHGSVDWFWEVPALGAPAFASLAIAAQVVRRDLPTGRPRLSLYRAGPPVVAGALAAASLVFPWLAAKEIDTATASWTADPAAAFHRLDVARRLNPLSDQPDLIAGVIASRVRDRKRERAAFERVLERNGHNWYARFELAVLDAQERRRAAALRGLREAHLLNPREPAITLVRQKVVRGERVSQAEIDRLFLDRTTSLTGARQR